MATVHILSESSLSLMLPFTLETMFEKKIHYTSVQGGDPEDECPPALKTTKTPRYIQWIGSTLLVASLVANAGLFFKGTRHSHTTTMPDGNHIRGFGMKSQYGESRRSSLPCGCRP